MDLVSEINDKLVKEKKLKLEKLEKNIEMFLKGNVFNHILENKFTEYENIVNQLKNDNLIPEEELEMFDNQVIEFSIKIHELKNKQVAGKLY